MTPEDKLLREIFGYKPKFKNKEIQEQYELNCMTVRGYEELWRLTSYVPKEDIDYIKTDFDVIHKLLLDNNYLKNMIELRAKRILKLKELNAPKIIIESEYRLFYEKVVKLLNISLTKEEIEELHKPVTDDE